MVKLEWQGENVQAEFLGTAESTIAGRNRSLRSSGCVWEDFACKKWIARSLYTRWCHVNWANLTGIKQDNVPKKNICTPCLHKAPLATNINERILDKFKQELSREISEVKDEVESQLYGVKESVSWHP